MLKKNKLFKKLKIFYSSYYFYFIKLNKKYEMDLKIQQQLQ